MMEISFARRLSLGLFTIGTLLLILFAVSLSKTIALVGYVFTGFSFFLGIMYCFILAIRVATKKMNGRTGIQSALVLMINIPIALIYAYLATMLLDIARVRFENATEADLTSIKILGCQSKEIDFLGVGESETVWIDIPGDCQVEIEYTLNGELKRETVASYLTNMNGLIATYKIGSNKDVLF